MKPRGPIGCAPILCAALLACQGKPAAPSAPPPRAAASALPPAPARAELAKPATAAPNLELGAKPTPEQLAEWRPTAPKMGFEALAERLPLHPSATTELMPIGEEMVAYGLPMNIAYYETRATPPEILEFYARHFTARRWSWTGLKETSQAVPHPAISATDHETLAQMSVMVLFNGKDQPRTVILSVADMRTAAKVPEDGELPRYPGSQPLAVRATEVGQVSHMVSFLATDPPAVVAEFYRVKMSSLGFAAAEPMTPPEEGEIALVFKKDARRWALGFERHEQFTLVTAVTQQEAP